jgi:hypothetical protein
MPHPHPHRRAFSLIGLLVTMVCIVILMVIGMNALNKAMTGEGAAVRGTVRSTQDMIQLSGIYQSMIVAGNDLPDSRLPVPSIFAESDDWSLNTTANLYSSMIARNYINPEILIAGNEFNPWIEVMIGYNYNAYDPRTGVFWDTNFKADLDDVSNASYAHMPLFGERYTRGWQASFDRNAVLLGNRGPKDGIHNPDSLSYGRSGQWGGHVVYGDGSIQFHTEFTPPGMMTERNGEYVPDNLFAMEQGPGGSDAILSFTKEMTRRGPVLQFD